MNTCRIHLRNKRVRAGLTLTEMMISISLLTIIMGGSASLVMVAAKGMANDASNVGTAAVTARAATDQITDDVKVATTITEQTATAITMTVPDRDGDGQVETIRYAWSGVAGDPLTRKYNSRAVATVAKDVRALNFTYLSKTAGKPAPVEGAVELMFSKTGSTGTVKQTDLTDLKFVAAYFKPTLVDKAVAWKISNCQVLIERSTGALGTVTAELKYADASKKPTGVALQSSSVSAANLLGSTSFTTFSFSNPAELDVSKGVCLVLTYVDISGSGAKVSYDDVNTDLRTAWLTSGDSGASWATPTTSTAMLHKINGTVTTQEAETLDFQPLPVAP